MHGRMRQAALFTAATVTLTVALGGAALAQSAGTWKLNLAKSKYQQGQAPKSATLLYEPAGAGIKVTVDQLPADGAPIHYAYADNHLYAFSMPGQEGRMDAEQSAGVRSSRRERREA